MEITAKIIAMALRDIAEDKELLAVADKHIEVTLTSLRDRSISYINPATGLVIRNADGARSSSVRMTVQDAVSHALHEIASRIEAEEKENEANW
jgi:hypothetical protein